MGSKRGTRQSDLIDWVYSAVCDVDGSQSLERIVDALEAECGFLGTLDISQHRGGRVVLARFDRSVFHQSAEAPPNPWAPCIVGNPPGVVGNTEHLVPYRRLARTEFKECFLHPLDIAYGLGCKITNDAILNTGLFLFRSRRKEPFDRTEEARLHRLFPHLLNAVHLAQRLPVRATEPAVALEVLEHLASGVILLDRQARVLFLNRTAREIVAANDGLVVRHGELVAADRRQAARLHALTGKLVASDGRLSAPLSMTLSRPSLSRPYSVLGMALTPSGYESSLRCTGALFVNDPERSIETDVRALQELFGLTPSEAEVAVAVARQGGLQEAADDLGIGRNTVHTHLQRVFEKTGTQRQAQLVRLLMMLGQVRFAEPAHAQELHRQVNGV